MTDPASLVQLAVRVGRLNNDMQRLKSPSIARQDDNERRTCLTPSIFRISAIAAPLVAGGCCVCPHRCRQTVARELRRDFRDRHELYDGHFRSEDSPRGNGSSMPRTTSATSIKIRWPTLRSWATHGSHCGR
jgi:hypothetical protein